MGARSKLNAAHTNGVLLIAGVAGYWMQSWLVFFVLIAILVGWSLNSGGIRPSSRRR